MNGDVGHGHTLRAKGWAHPRPGLTIDELVERMAALGNPVQEVHRACDCEGAAITGVPDDHLLLIDVEVAR